MSIGEKIKKNRLRMNWTQETLANLLNVSRSTVSSWEVGRNYPDINTILSMSDLFEISLDQLLREDQQLMKKIEQDSKDLIALQKLDLRNKAGTLVPVPLFNTIFGDKRVPKVCSLGNFSKPEQSKQPIVRALRECSEQNDFMSQLLSHCLLWIICHSTLNYRALSVQ